MAMPAPDIVTAPVASSGQLDRFLLGATSSVPALELLRAHGLGPYVYTALDPDHPTRGVLRPDFAQATVRHIAVRVQIARLVRAWREAGIDALIFKGFYLAEFVYTMPAQRHYNDVDILIHPEAASEASRIAVELGWQESWSAARPASMFNENSQSRHSNYRGHEVLNLDYRDLALRLDVHRRIIHNKLPITRVQEHITGEAWRASEEIDWNGTKVRALHPLDSILIGLVMNRCWGSDEWNLKASDYLDFQALALRFGITKDAMLERARGLRCERTLTIFLQRCNFHAETLDLRPPTAGDRIRWGFSILRERGHPGLERSLVRAWGFPGEVIDVLKAVPSVMQAFWCLGRHGRGLSRKAHSAHHGASLLGYYDWKRLQRAVRRIMKISRKYPDSDNELFVLSLFFALRRRGLAVGIERADGPNPYPSSHHMRLELDGREIPVTIYADHGDD